MLGVSPVALCLLVLSPASHMPSPHMNSLCKELYILPLSHLLCLLQHFEEKSLLWAVIRIIWISGSGPQLSSNEHHWVWIRGSRCVGLVIYVVISFPHDSHAFQLRTTSLYFTCQECSFVLQTLLTSTFSEEVPCDVAVTDLCCVQASSLIWSIRKGQSLKIVFS